MAKELLKLTATEIFFLRWLRENGGSGASSGNNWIGAVDRLVLSVAIVPSVARIVTEANGS